MAYRVTVRINAGTGEIEVFQVDDLAIGRPREEHDEDHDRISQHLGALVERRPEIEEVLPGGPDIPTVLPAPRFETESDEQSQRDREQLDY